MGFTFNMALYHYMIWVAIGLGGATAIMTIAVILYAVFFENRDD